MVGDRRKLGRAVIRLGLAAIAAAVIAAGHGALAQTGTSVQPHPPAAPGAIPAGQKSAAPISPAVDADQIVKRLNGALGLDLSAAIANWQPICMVWKPICTVRTSSGRSSIPIVPSFSGFARRP